MNDSELEPIAKDVADLLRPGAAVPLSAAKRAAMFDRIDASLNVAAAVGTSGAAAAGAKTAVATTASLSAAKIGAIVLVSAAAGAGVSRVVEHRYFPPEPVVIERVVPAPMPVVVAPPVVEVPPAPVVVETPKPVVRVEKPAEPREKPEVISSKERQLVESARTALLRGDAQAALTAIASHRAQFPTGQLAEERDSLEVQALVHSGRIDDARAAAKRFRATYRDSVLGPAVDAFVQ